MALIDYELDESVAVITMRGGENRFNPAFVDAFMETLHRIETRTDATGVVVTSAHDKIFSTGMDFQWFQPVIRNRDDAAFRCFFSELGVLMKRLVTYPLITVAAVSGHAFALGAIFCGAFDFRFMRADRGYFCLPAIDLGLALFPSMIALLQKAIPRYKLDEVVLTGVRLTAAECETHHIIRRAFPAETLLPEAIAFAKRLNKRREVLAEMKRRLNRDILEALEVADIPYIAAGTGNAQMSILGE